MSSSASSARRARYAARDFVRSFTSLARLRQCGNRTVTQAGAQLRVSAEGGAGFCGVQLCGSVWSCPSCSAAILAGRTDEVRRAVEWWLKLSPDHAIALVTSTVAHTPADRLADLLAGMGEAWRNLTKRRGYRDLRGRVGWSHEIRSLEARVSLESGWHPHYHRLVFLDRHLSPDALADFAGAVAAEWSQACAEVGLRATAAGQDVTVFHGSVAEVSRDASGYVTKEVFGQPVGDDALRVGFEMTRGDLKRSRSSLSPFELLAQIRLVAQSHGGDRSTAAHLIALWREWEQATRGRRSQYWSRGLKDACGVRDLSDEQLADDAGGTSENDTVLVVPGRSFRRLALLPGAVCGLIEAAEVGFREAGRDGAGLCAAEYLDALGIRYAWPPPLDLPAAA